MSILAFAAGVIVGIVIAAGALWFMFRNAIPTRFM